MSSFFSAQNKTKFRFKGQKEIIAINDGGLVICYKDKVRGSRVEWQPDGVRPVFGIEVQDSNIICCQ
jgi:hypothetical protein